MAHCANRIYICKTECGTTGLSEPVMQCASSAVYARSQPSLGSTFTARFVVLPFI